MRSSPPPGRPGAPLVYAAEGVECVVSGAAGGRLTITLDTATRTYGPVRLALAGEHQVANAFVAVALLEALDDAGIHVDRRAVETGLGDARWPGRLDRVALPDGRRALLDAAHNAAGARALAAWLGRTTPAAPPLVFAAAARQGRRRHDPRARAGRRRHRRHRVRRCASDRRRRARGPGPGRARRARRGGRVERVHVAATTAAALETAWRLSRDIVVAGSIFLLGEAYPLLGRPDPFEAGPFDPGSRRSGELSRMAVLSCGVVPAGSRSLVRALVALLFVLVAAPGAGAQAPAPAAPAATDVRLGSAARQERLGLHHIRYSGAVEIELVAQGIRFSADVADYYDDQHRLVAVGNVVFVTPSSRISADKADFDTRSRTGTFFNAFGSASVSDKVDKSFFGGQEPDAFFYGETIEKIGVDRYRIHKGAFTTCVQPTPRWEVAAGTVTLTIDKRAVLKNAVLKVKDVPLFYVPAMYYPINKEDRSTGFLLPVYGTSTIRGTSFSNAFFWAINRSQDLTVMHDWFTRTGQGYGGEYRYVASAGSNGEFRMYRLNERASTFEQNGTPITQPARKSFEIRTNVVQGLPGGFKARGSVDYFSDVTVQQQYQMDLYNATLRTRNYQGNVSGSLGRGNSISGTYGINEIFYGDVDSQTIGGRPRIQYNRALTKLGALPLYFTADGEYANIVRYDSSGDVKINDQGLTRYDISPSLQFPLTKWPFLSVRSSITWRNTYWTESLGTATCGRSRSRSSGSTTTCGPASPARS